MLKTTQSGYEGFLHDKYTLLKDTKERIVATAITSTWRCGHLAPLLLLRPAGCSCRWCAGSMHAWSHQ